MPSPHLPRWRAEDRFDGELEQDAKYPKKRRLDIPSVPAFVDRHAQRHRDKLPPKSTAEVKVFQIPLTGSVLTRNPHYRIMPAVEDPEWLPKQDLSQPASLREAWDFAAAFCQDHLQLSSTNGHTHVHHNKCFKYVEDGIRRKPQYCRFNFVHFAHLWITPKHDTNAKPRLRTIARAGKEPVLPQVLGQKLPSLTKKPLTTSTEWFAGVKGFGVSVEVDDRQARRGRTNTVQFNPREGSTAVAAVPAHRGNLNYQDCRRTLPTGFDSPGAGGLLRDTIEEVKKRGLVALLTFGF